MITHKISLGQKVNIQTAADNEQAIQTACEMIAFDIAKYLAEGDSLPEAIKNTFMILVDEIETIKLTH